MSGHSHSHGCDGDHNHDETPEMGLQYSLYTKIDIDNLQCLNETVEDSGKSIFKPWEERLNMDKVTHNRQFYIFIKKKKIVFPYI